MPLLESFLLGNIPFRVLLSCLFRISLARWGGVGVFIIQISNGNLAVFATGATSILGHTIPHTFCGSGRMRPSEKVLASEFHATLLLLSVSVFVASIRILHQAMLHNFQVPNTVQLAQALPRMGRGDLCISQLQTPALFFWCFAHWALVLCLGILNPAFQLGVHTVSLQLSDTQDS